MTVRGAALAIALATIACAYHVGIGGIRGASATVLAASETMWLFDNAAMAELLTLEMAQMLRRAFSVPIERLGWQQEIGSDPIEPPASGPITHFNRRIEFLLQNDPIVVPPRALPPGTQQQRPPAWAYRREILEDLRDDLARLPG